MVFDGIWAELGDFGREIGVTGAMIYGKETKGGEDCEAGWCAKDTDEATRSQPGGELTLVISCV